MNWRNIGTLLFLVLPASGLWLLLEGLYHGPNYFGARVIVVDSLESSTSTTRSLRSSATDTQTVWRVDYRYTDRHGNVRHDQKRFRQNELPPSARQPGDQLFTLIPVDKEEGGFGLNWRAEQGLSLMLIFGFMSLPAIVQLRWRDNPSARRTWYQTGTAILGVIALCLYLL